MNQEERFGQALKELRAQKGWSVQKAAVQIGISRYRLDELERGRSRSTGNPTRASRDTVKSLARVYGVPADHLLDLAGYSREHPELTDEDALLLDLFHRLNPEERAMILRMLQAAPREHAASQPE